MAEVTSARDEEEVSVAWVRVTHHPDAANRLLVAEVARRTGTPRAEVRITRGCPRCGSPDHGTPVVVTPREGAPWVSLSRADGIVIAAVSTAGPVGVDVERLDAARFAGFAQVALHSQERATTIEDRAALWARKESLLKATGDALHLNPASVRLSNADQRPELLEWPGPKAPIAQLQDLEIGGYAASLTVLSETSLRVTMRQEAPEALAW
jgi:4'-phosphopantetheinyl transferase